MRREVANLVEAHARLLPALNRDRDRRVAQPMTPDVDADPLSELPDNAED